MLPGFTLVELLVVIGIIAVLIRRAAACPQQGARQSAQTIACSSNLRQVSQAIFNYATEYKGSLPYGFIFNKSGPNGRPAGSENPVKLHHLVQLRRQVHDRQGFGADPAGLQHRLYRRRFQARVQPGVQVPGRAE
jgi:prepilin-type N-terminal cleavage/methylation domain-containing protein